MKHQESEGIYPNCPLTNSRTTKYSFVEKQLSRSICANFRCSFNKSISKSRFLEVNYVKSFPKGPNSF